MAVLSLLRGQSINIHQIILGGLMIPPQTAWGWRVAVFAVALLFFASLTYVIALLAGVI